MPPACPVPRDGARRAPRRAVLRAADDDRLVALVRAGSDEAFAEIVRRYQPELRGRCARVIDRHLAEDAVQQAFLQAFRALRREDDREIALRPWLHRIARNCALNARSRGGCAFEEADHPLDRLLEPARVVERKQELQAVLAGLNALPASQRRALVARELEGRSYEEIAAELGRTPSGIRQAIFRARLALRAAAALLPPAWLRVLLPFSGAGSGAARGDALVAAGVAVAAAAGLAGPLSAPPAAHDRAARPALVAGHPRQSGRALHSGTPPFAESLPDGATPGAGAAPAAPRGRAERPRLEAHRVPARSPLPGADPVAPAPSVPPVSSAPPAPGAPAAPGAPPATPEAESPTAGRPAAAEAVAVAAVAPSAAGDESPGSSGSGPGGSGSGPGGSGSDSDGPEVDGSDRRGPDSDDSNSDDSDSDDSDSDDSDSRSRDSSGRGPGPRLDRGDD